MMNQKTERIIDSLAATGIEYAADSSVAARSSFKIGGRAALAVFPKSERELVDALSLIDGEGVRCEIIGNASNLLFAFDYFDGALIFTSGLGGISVDGNKISCGAGVSLTHLSSVAAEHSLTGLEFAYGIPALVGGAVYMNAGAYGGAISDVIDYSIAYDRKSGRVYRLYDCDFSYRHSKYMSDPSLVCLGAVFALPFGNEEEIKEKMAQNMASRKANQPLEYPSAGSYFKRPEGHFAGKLIEDCGLKGLSVGGAQVSKKHAGFIINRGGATYSDVLALEEKIKEKVFSEFGVELEREVRVIMN